MSSTDRIFVLLLTFALLSAPAAIAHGDAITAATVRSSPSSPGFGAARSGGSAPRSPEAAPSESTPGERAPAPTAVLNVDSGLFFATLQDAISNATAGDTLEVQAALLDTGRVTVDRNLTLRGGTGTETLLMTEDTGNSGDDRAWFLVNAGVDLHVRDLGFGGNGFLVHQAFRHRGTGSFENCRFLDIQFNAAGPDFAGIAIVAFGGTVDVRDSTFDEIGRVGILAFGAGLDGAVIEGNTYTGKGDGPFLDYAVEVGAGAGVVLWNNTVRDCRGIAPDGSESAAVLATTSFGAGTSAVISENTFTDNHNGIFVGFSAATPDGSTVTASLNRISGNTFGVVDFSTVPIVAENNWWGCNGGPGAAGCDPIDVSGVPPGGLVDADPRLVLALAAAPPSVIIRGSSSLTADLTDNSDGVDTSALGHLPDMTPALFGSPTLADVSPTLTSTVLGRAISTYTAGAFAGADTVDVTVDNETVALVIPVDPAPELLIREGIAAGALEPVTVPVEFHANGESITAIAFSLDFDETCLAFDPTDADLDGIPDAITFNLPVSYSAGVFVDLGDTDGEIDVIVSEIPPQNPLADDVIADIVFTTLCTPPLDSSITAPVGFSSAPAASFGDLLGQDVPGNAVGGSVEILAGLRGDCNGDGFLSAGDVSACGLELFDGDGGFWLDVPGGTFAGNPVGCDANADTLVDAGDVSCKERLIFSLPCAAPLTRVADSPIPELTMPYEISLSGTTVTVPVRVMTGGHDLNTLVFSLDYDETLYAFDPTDTDADGLPDTVRYFAALRSVSVSFAAADSDGEIDILLTDGSAAPRVVADGPVMEIDLRYLGTSTPADGTVRWSVEPGVSFGHVTGVSVPGEARVVATPLFADGFESGTVSAWSNN